MRNLFLSYVVGIAFLSGLALGQGFEPAAFGVIDAANPAGGTILAATHTPDLAAPIPLPRMAPELALQAFQGRSVIQNQQLSSYSATTVVHAELPDTAQQGEFVQDYEDFGNFTFPIHIHSDARARVIGRAVVDIYHRDYRQVAAGIQSAQQNSSAPPLASE